VILLSGCSGSARGGDDGPEQDDTAARRVVAFAGGRWFTGTSFEERTAYVVGGVLTFEPPARVDSTVDLAGATWSLRSGRPTTTT